MDLGNMGLRPVDCIRVCGLNQLAAVRKAFAPDVVLDLVMPQERGDVPRPHPWLFSLPVRDTGPHFMPTENNAARDVVDRAAKVFLEHPKARVLVHCHAGVSRSPSIALLFLLLRNGADIRRAYEDLFEIVSLPLPVCALVAEIDNRFGFSGKLLQVHELYVEGLLSPGALVTPVRARDCMNRALSALPEV